MEDRAKVFHGVLAGRSSMANATYPARRVCAERSCTTQLSIYNASGVRVREYPITLDKIIAGSAMIA